MAKSKDVINYNNIPWGGVRFSTLKSMVLARKEGAMHSLPPIGTEHLMPEVNAWGTGGLYHHKHYGGYVYFYV